MERLLALRSAEKNGWMDFLFLGSRPDVDWRFRVIAYVSYHNTEHHRFASEAFWLCILPAVAGGDHSSGAYAKRFACGDVDVGWQVTLFSVASEHATPSLAYMFPISHEFLL